MSTCPSCHGSAAIVCHACHRPDPAAQDLLRRLDTQIEFLRGPFYIYQRDRDSLRRLLEETREYLERLPAAERRPE
jgi:hypothetical protein